MLLFYRAFSAGELADVYAKSKALIFPQLEDYGITPLEANASGRPVIAFGKGGVLDTMIPVGENYSQEATAVFFEPQDETSLTNAIIAFEKMKFDPLFIRAHAEKFDEFFFVDKIRNFVTRKYRKVPVNKLE